MADHSTPQPQPLGSPPKRRMSTGAKVAIGCGVVLGACVLLIVVAVAIIAVKFKDIAAGLITVGADAFIQQSSLSESEKQDAKETVRKFTKLAMDGKIPREKAEALMQQLMQGPLGKFLRFGLISQAIENSTLTPEEKADAKRNLEKFIQGVLQKQISDEESARVADLVPQADRGPPVPTSMTDEELRAVLDEITAVVEGKDIKPTGKPPDMADEIRDVVREMKALIEE